MRIQTNFNGITTTSSYAEGESYSLVNLRKKNGVLHPVAPRKTELVLSDNYDIVFLHQFNDFKNWIGVKHIEDEGSEIYYNINDNPEFIFKTGITLDDRILSIQQIGNTLSLITGNKILYLLFINNKYKLLGEIPEIEPVKWFNYGYYYTKSEQFIFANGEDWDEIIKTKDSFNEWLNLHSRGIFSELRKNIYDNVEGCLFDSHIMILAFQLFDGTYTKQTPPIVLCGNLFESANIYYGGFFDIDEGLKYTIRIGLNASKIYLEFDLDYLDDWKDIIKSVDVFLSPGLGKCSESNFKEKFEMGSAGLYLFSNMMNDDLQMYRNIISTGNFYLVDSIPIVTKSQYIDDMPTNLQKMFSFPKKEILSDINLLLHRIELPADQFSHHSVTGNVSYAYNNRLHIANVKTTLFKGFNVDYFALPERFLGKSYFGKNYIFPVGSTWEIPTNDAPDKTLKYNGITPFAGNAPNGIMVAVYLRLNYGEVVVYSEYNGTTDIWYNPLFTYPDPRAYKVEMYKIISTNQYSKFCTFDLKPSPVNNLAYFINATPEGGSKTVLPLLAFMEWFTSPDVTIDNIDVMPTIRESNKLKVSELNNPFLFPNKTTYLVSNGTIINLASVAIRISEGQFGQYPLYVFTDKGIYSMSIGSGEVVYSSEAAPTSFEVPISPVVCQTPFGVIFTSARGVCIISGQKVELLTYPLQQQPKELNIKSVPALTNFGHNSFTDYLKQIEFIIYNPHENEIIIIDRDLSFNFVMNFDSKQFYFSTEKIDLVVENTFPELLVIEDRKVKNYALSEPGKQANVSLISRPLNFGTIDFKKLERMFLRANLINSVDSIILNYYSIDEVNFFALRGIFIGNGNYKDFDMGLFSRSKYRQFLFAFAGMLDEKSEIKYLETEIRKVYDNEKMT